MQNKALPLVCEERIESLATSFSKWLQNQVHSKNAVPPTQNIQTIKSVKNRQYCCSLEAFFTYVRVFKLININ